MKGGGVFKEKENYFSIKGTSSHRRHACTEHKVCSEEHMVSGFPSILMQKCLISKQSYAIMQYKKLSADRRAAQKRKTDWNLFTQIVNCGYDWA